MTDEDKAPVRKRWSEQTTEERLDHAIKVWEKNLARVDHDGTALNHETYDKDPVRFSTASDYQTFVQVLHSIRDRNVWPLITKENNDAK